MFLLWHPSLTAINLSYTFPILETSATALCGTTGNMQIQCPVRCLAKKMLYSGPKSKILILNFGLERFWVWIPDFWILGDPRDVPLANSVTSWRPVWVPFFGYIFSYPTWRVRSWISSSVIFSCVLQVDLNCI